MVYENIVKMIFSIMENQNDLIRQCELKALQWLDSPVYDDVTKKAVREMLDKEDKTDLIDSFYQNLAFGTGGLRGIMGPGSNRMNIYTVRQPKGWQII